MNFKIVGENQNIPKELIVNQRIVDVNLFNNTTVLFLENGYDFYFHNDTGEIQLLKIEEEGKI